MNIRQAALKAVKVIVAAIFAAVLTLVVLVLGYGLYQAMFFGPTEFDREVWLAGGAAEFSDTAPRLRMADGLLESGVLLGKTEAEILGMLGPQTDTQYFRSEYKFVYWLGAERGWINIDSEWLVLNPGTEGTISEARIVRD